MKSLQTLHLNGCSSLKRFPEVTGEMGRLLVLNIDGCDRIKALPSSIALLTGLIILTMGKYAGGSIRILVPNSNLHILGSAQLSSPRLLDLKHNCLVEEEFPCDMHNVWPSLEKLDLSKNNFGRVFTGISQLSHLKHLNLSFCHNLTELHELPSLIQVLRADGCFSLHKIGDLSYKYKWLFKISFSLCDELPKDQESSRHLANLSMKSLVLKCAAVNHQLSITVPERTIPSWFSHLWLGNKIALNIPQNQITKMMGLSICCLFGPGHHIDDDLKIKFRSSVGEKSIDTLAYAGQDARHIWMGYMPIHSLQNLCRGFDSETLVITFRIFPSYKL